MVKVKICGITNLEDASVALELGAEALGYIFAPSPRQVSPQKARTIIRALPPLAKAVGVFVDQDPTFIREIVEYCGIDIIQLHGKETPGFCRLLMPRSVKAVRLQDTADLLPLPAYRHHVRALLLDTYEKGKKGGTGKVFDWGLAVAAGTFGIPLILAGGLNPLNIERAILTVRPYGVDLNSGIEERPGKKSHALMDLIMEKIRTINQGGRHDV